MAEGKSKTGVVKKRASKEREEGLDCGVYIYCAGYLRPSGVLYLAIYPEYLV